MSDTFLGRIVATRIRQEGNHMVQAASLFNQLLHHFPRTEFAALVAIPVQAEQDSGVKANSIPG